MPGEAEARSKDMIISHRLEYWPRSLQRFFACLLFVSVMPRTATIRHPLSPCFNTLGFDDSRHDASVAGTNSNRRDCLVTFDMVVKYDEKRPNSKQRSSTDYPIEMTSSRPTPDVGDECCPRHASWTIQTCPIDIYDALYRVSINVDVFALANIKLSITG